jgi:exopolyphosphatase / guanosine-5'-triphosphate,3'-diphosphate pyrophosphatase
MASQWNVPDSHVAAFIDIGTNSLRLLLVRINPNHSYTILSDQKEIVRLGEGEFIDQYLRPEAMQRAALVAKRFTHMARSYGAEEIIAVATAATREAENRDEFLRRLHREAQIDVKIVSGREEARLIYLGVVSGVHLGDKNALFIDIGGGSTEIILGGQEQYTHLDSLKLGAIRLNSLFFLPNETGPVSGERYALLQQYVRNLAVRAVQRIRDERIDIAFGSSGTIENLADISVLKFHKRQRQRDDVLTREQLRQVVEMLCAMPLDERRGVPGINPMRADIIICGAAIIETLMADFGIEELSISERGLRDGLLIDYLTKDESSGLEQGISVRGRSVLQLGRTCGIDEPHARHVACLALELFDSAQRQGLHKLGDRERELLDYSAMIHDVGTFLSYSNHHEHSYYLIRNADLLGFDQGEIAILANAALFHRKSMPSQKKHPEFAALDKRSQRSVRLFALLLRMAESLDRSHTGVVQSARLVVEDKDEVTLVVEASQECDLEIWGVQTHREAFKKVFKRRMAVKTVIGDKVSTVPKLPLPDSAEIPGN